MIKFLKKVVFSIFFVRVGGDVVGDFCLSGIGLFKHFHSVVRVFLWGAFIFFTDFFIIRLFGFFFFNCLDTFEYLAAAALAKAIENLEGG